MRDTEVIARVQRKFAALEPVLDERGLRQWAGAEAESLGRGGVSAVSAATGLSRTTVAAGAGEVRERGRGEEDAAAARARAAGRVRRAGGGRKAVTETDPALRR